MHLCLAVHLLQILLGFQPLSAEEQEQLPPCPFSDSQAVDRLWKQVSAFSGKSNFNVPSNLGAQVRHKLGRFLRSASLFLNLYTDVPLPKAKEERQLEHEQLCAYLGLPATIRDFLMVLGVQDVIDRCVCEVAPTLALIVATDVIVVATAVVVVPSATAVVVAVLG